MYPPLPKKKTPAGGVVEIEIRLTNLVVGAVVAAMLSRREPRPEKTTLACIPDALLARIANLAIDDLRLARAGCACRRDVAERNLWLEALYGLK